MKEFVRRAGDHVELRQYKPPMTFNVDATDIEAIYKVAGEII